jgi:hypothetical protein
VAASITASAAPVVPLVSQPVDDGDGNSDLIAATASAPDLDLLAVSLSNGLVALPSTDSYIPGLEPISAGPPAILAATAEYDLQPLADDLLTDDTGDVADDGLYTSIGADDSLDILAESPIAMPL